MLELKLLHVNENDTVNTNSFTILEDINRDDAKYTRAIRNLKSVFNIIDNEMLSKYNNNEEVKYNNDTTEESNTMPQQNIVEKSIDTKEVFDKLKQLKELYDEGIIDEATYEAKKKKFIDLL